MDAETFQRKALECERLLYHVSYSMLRNNQDCADAVQEALLQAWRHRTSLRSQEGFRAWLVRILINTCKTMLRKNKYALLTELNDRIPAAQQPDYTALYDALDTLPPNMRAATVLYYFEGFSVREVAHMVGAHESAVKSRLLYARRKLREQLGEDIVCAGEEADV